MLDKQEIINEVGRQLDEVYFESDSIASDEDVLKRFDLILHRAMNARMLIMQIVEDDYCEEEYMSEQNIIDVLNKGEWFIWV